MEVIIQLLRVSDPAAVGRPSGVELVVGTRVSVRIHAHGSLLVDVHKPDIQALVGISDLLAVRRPDGRIVKSGRVAEADFSDFPQAALGADVEFVLA